MKQEIIDFSNAFEASVMKKNGYCHSGYLRVIEYLDNKEHSLPQACECDLLNTSSNGSL